MAPSSPGASSAADPLSGFSAATRAWFEGAFEAPTPAQTGAWAAIDAGRDALVVAPTGSGKTLAAFLWSLDRLASEPAPVERQRRCRVVYVSPMKALAVDVERNLRSPLTGIRQAAHRLGVPEPDVSVAIRTGDTPASDRRRFMTHPPDILITTPESLFLILTSQARESLRGVETVIVDEVHAVAGTKRGAHLALSLERLDALLDKPARRIGLSATVRPVDEVGRYLVGTRDVEVVQPPSTKTIELQVVVPVEDMAEMGASTGEVRGSASGEPERASIWPHVEERVLDLDRGAPLDDRLRQLAPPGRAALRTAQRAPPRASHRRRRSTPRRHRRRSWRRAVRPTAPRRRSPAPTTAASAASSDASSRRTSRPAGSRRSWRPAASSSASTWAPSTSSSRSSRRRPSPAGLQRVGRAGHQVGAVSKGVIFPKYRGDLVQTAVVAESMRAGRIEALRVPRNPLDVLAQQVVAMVAMDPWQVDDLLALVRRAAPFASLPQSAYDAVLDMLAGRYPSDAFAELRPRIVWDRVTGELTARPGAQRLAVTSGGTIPDRGLFGVFLVGEKAVTRRRARRGDGLRVAASATSSPWVRASWRIEDITHDRVLVSPAPGQPGRLPFWKGDALGRPAELGKAVGAFVRTTAALDDDAARERVQAAGLDAWAADNLLELPARAARGHRPPPRRPHDRRRAVPRRARRLAGRRPLPLRRAGPRALGARPRGPLPRALRRRRPGHARRRRHRAPAARERPARRQARLRRAWSRSSPAEVEPLVTAEVGGSALFASRFRECAARALLLPRRRPDRRTPLWQQRQRVGPAAVGGERVRLVPDRARDDARVPAGRVRRPRPRPR